MRKVLTALWVASEPKSHADLPRQPAPHRNQARTAHKAYRDFGKGSVHPAKLNFGDCFAYTFAKAKGEPLLFKCDDFAHTNVKPGAR